MPHAAALAIGRPYRPALSSGLPLGPVWRFNGGMPDSKVDFSAPATLRKWPSLNDQRVSASLGARTYMIIERHSRRVHPEVYVAA
jgi:hypothetical protein